MAITINMRCDECGMEWWGHEGTIHACPITKQPPTPKFNVGDVVHVSGRFNCQIKVYATDCSNNVFYNNNQGYCPEICELRCPANAVESAKKSFAKWHNIGMGRIKDEGVENCALCQRFIHSKNGGCPIGQMQGFSGCPKDCHPLYNRYYYDKTPANAFAFRDWIGENLLTPEIVAEVIKQEDDKYKPKEETFKVGEYVRVTTGLAENVVCRIVIVKIGAFHYIGLIKPNGERFGDKGFIQSDMNTVIVTESFLKQEIVYPKTITHSTKEEYDRGY